MGRAKRALLLSGLADAANEETTMLAGLLVATVVSTLPNSSGQVVRHAFAAEQVDCASGGPHSRAEWEEILQEWRSDGSLHVEFWASETASNVIDRNWSRARLHNSALTFAYRLEPVEQNPDGPFLACSFPVRMKIDFFDLQHHPYEFHIEIVSSQRTGTISE